MMSAERRKSSKRSMNKKNSISPKDIKDNDDSDDAAFKLLIKGKDLKLDFTGEYVGRELVQNTSSLEYKDIVVVNKDEKVISTLNEIYDNLYPQSPTTWLGITRTVVKGEVHNYKLWVKLNEIPLGRHRFEICTIVANGTSVELRLRVLKLFESSFTTNTLDDDNYLSLEDKEMSTYHNIREVMKFCAVLIMSILTIAGNILWYCADYSLKLSRELVNLIEVLTPIIFGILDFMSKCVGGFYWLIYMLWCGNSAPSRPAILNQPPLAIMPKITPKRNYSKTPKSSPYSYDPYRNPNPTRMNSPY